MSKITVNQDKVKLIQRQGMVVSRFQAKAALAQAGLLDSVETLIKNAETPLVARLAWQDAQEFRRLSPTIETIGHALGLTDAQMDQLFETAKTIEA